MVNTMNQSFSEVYDILMHLETKLFRKIPQKFIDMIKENRDTGYKVSIDYTKDINQQELLKETRVILSLIYRDYLCSSEKREELRNADRIELEKFEYEMREKYNPDNIFKNNKETEQIQDLPIEIKKDNLIQRVINYIKDYLKKDKL